METNEEIKRVDPPAEENNEAQPVAVNATEPAEALAATPQPATEDVPTPVEEPPVAPDTVAEPQPIVTETPAMRHGQLRAILTLTRTMFVITAARVYHPTYPLVTVTANFSHPMSSTNNRILTASIK
jgi:hypothetical protein